MEATVEQAKTNEPQRKLRCAWCLALITGTLPCTCSSCGTTLDGLVGIWDTWAEVAARRGRALPPGKIAGEYCRHDTMAISVRCGMLMAA